MEIENQAGTTSLGRTCFNGLNTLLGIGILASPYALSEGGWTSLAILLAAGIICCYTGILLKRCIDMDPETRTYPDIAERAFGKMGRVLVSALLYLELYMVSVEMLIMEGDNLAKVFPAGIDKKWSRGIGVRNLFIALASLVILPTTWMRNMSLLAYLSAGGILATIIVLVSVVSVGIFGGVGFHQRGQLFNLKKMPAAMSLFIFCFGGHGVFPSLYNSMADKIQFSKVLVFCFVTSIIGYGSMAIFGYLMYGEHLKDQVTLNLPLEKVATRVAMYTTLIGPLTKFALMVNPISTSMEEKISLHQFSSFKRILYWNILRTTLVASTLLVALVVPKFGYVMAFIGSFLIVSLSIIIPCACYLRLHHFPEDEKAPKIIVWVILVLGLAVGIIGTISSVEDILKSK